MIRSVCFVIGDLDVGGAERHLTQITPALKQRGCAPFVYVTTHKGKLAPQLEAMGVEVIAPPLYGVLRMFPSKLRRLFLAPLSAIRLWLLLLSRRPDVVHFFLPSAYIIGGLVSLFTFAPIKIMSRRSLNVYQAAHPFLSKVEMWLHPRMRAVLGNAKAVTHQLADEGVASCRLGLIYNGIDLSAFTEMPTRTEARQILNLRDDDFVMVIVANLIPYKGHADLLEALASITDRLPQNWKLLCAGRANDYGEQLKLKSEELSIDEHICWLGERQDIAVLHCAGDASLLCSHQEGFSNAILEAMAAARPVIATDVGGNGEAIIDNESGLIVPPHDPDMLAEAIVRIQSDPALRQSMGQAGQTRVQSLFSIDTCANRYQSLYEGLISRKSGAVQDLINSFEVEGDKQ